jgi:hypothetical protein
MRTPREQVRLVPREVLVRPLEDWRQPALQGYCSALIQVDKFSLDTKSGLLAKDGEIRVNQSGSVALSAEEVRGPPQRKWLIIMALLTQKPDYEPGGRGFKSCRARHFSDIWPVRVAGFLLDTHLRRSVFMRERIAAV